MENTLDSIRPSENPQEDMSYLFGRDPSILAYSQRPLLSKITRKNLLSVYETEEDNFTNDNASERSESQTLQTIKVYLRLKPFPKKLKLTEDQQEAYKIANSTTLLTKLPILDNSGSIKQSKSNEIICRKFIFSQTFGPETTQLELFEQTVQQQMIEFLAGQNCTIMTYGTTNSGKSYTLQGTPTSPGLVPRALEFVFNNVTTRPNPFYKPLHYSDVITLNALERAQELEVKTKLLTFGSVDKHQYMNTYKQMQKLLQEESIRPSQCYDAHYSVWVSFAEIYNEIVYDLLSNECQKKRIPLKLGADSNGRAFIRGLKTIYVNSAAEAYQILMAGQYNLKVAATALNAKSSRSHCIFTIILLKYYAENLPDTVEVSTFSFCDLAGSERLKKTLNIGDRLKEAQNINTSLLVLGRCLKSIHEGQLVRTKTDTVGPFRESKLTRLFQRALSGKEHLALIVNVNPLPNLYVETQNVLNFAAIAKRIVIERKKQIQKKLKSRFSQIVTQSIQTVTDWDTTELESVDWQPTSNAEDDSEYITSEEYMDLANENEKLKKEIALLKNSALIQDLQSRQEMADKYISMINELEVDWKRRINDVESQHEDALEWTVKQVEEFYKGKLSQLSRKRRKHSECTDGSDEDDDSLKITINELIKESTQLREKNETLKKTLTELKITNETLIVEKNKAFFELGLSKEDLKVARNLLETAQKDICFAQNGEAYIKEMTSQLLVKDEQIKKLKEILNEAKEEYITITSDLKKKELCIDEQAKIIVENEEKIEDLELHLEDVNVCLTEKTRIVELLEEKLEHQNENKILQMQEEINKLKDEKLALIKSYEEKLNSTTSTQNEYQEIIIKEELITEVSEDSSMIRKNVKEGTENGTVSAKETDSNNLNPTEEKTIPKRILVDTGCQVDIINAKDYNEDSKNELEESTQGVVTITTSEGIQTSSKMSLKEEAVQTDDIADDSLKLQLNALTQINDDMKKTLQTLKEENHSNKTIVDEYKNSAEVLKKQLALATEEKRKIEETLLSSDTASKQKIADYECEIDRLEKNLAAANENAQQYMEKLETTQKELDDYMLKCKEEEKETDVRKSDKFVSVKEEDIDTNNMSVNQLDEYAEKISQLEDSLETIDKLKYDIDQLNQNLETCRVEKNCIQMMLEKNNKELSELESRLQETAVKEQEKDVEIATLQKELKRMIQKIENAERADDMMETELKSAINELAQTKQKLLEKEQHLKELKIHSENFERNAKILNLLEQNAKERQVENERLRNINDDLRTSLTQKEREMDAFMKNRDETVTKYEALVKNQQEELDMQKREVMRYQELFRRQMTPTPNKDDYKKLQNRVEILQDRLQKYESGSRTKNDCDSTSEEEVLTQRQTKRRGKKTAVLSARQENIPVIELSGSESKRSTRNTTLPPPETTLPPAPSTEKRRTRRKKLFLENDSFAEIEPVAASLPTRNLRNRKK
ncbi:PREDICTED: kinesin-like protein KIF20B [Wasmannia auropunctata]|uniref:kinesin-like protein KIF20B n=1 Tax=Wasmannia auropunctata TaxID=64793 RepID=UPI0005F02A8A|nr:PREDICTED: kinesin-like protein KIF20B [Wasmannia auropunctata]XP_011705044.1 PREDICTED: kinesin-like protein KIF20B [Wasmannia auropunctata]XP_011705045.1 PREDICTED: kinesin-like protein KIF20B [Wasmannia auropunctata]XP_011705046.1 PREDICTED: kinesin-like protein KIF20B [Wasmannia auropunctata]